MSDQISRRSLFKGAGATAAGAALLHTVKEATAAVKGAQIQGPNAVPITLKLNGVARKLSVTPSTTLAEALRVNLAMTGTKVVCDRGSCSACTVHLDETPVCSCMTLAVDVGDRAVTTIEGLADGDALHPVQEAFIANDALQCGFCTPGMVMSCAALLKRKSDPTLDDVKNAVSGNLCRCGTYPKVFAATLAAAKKVRHG